MSCGKVCGICVEEPADFGVVISALEVVEAALGIVVVASVAEGVVYSQGGSEGTCGGEEFPPTAI